MSLSAIDTLRRISHIIGSEGDATLQSLLTQLRFGIATYRTVPAGEAALEESARKNKASSKVRNAILAMKKHMITSNPTYQVELNDLLTNISKQIADFAVSSSSMSTGPAGGASGGGVGAAPQPADPYFRDLPELQLYLTDNITDADVRTQIESGFTTTDLTYYGLAMDAIRNLPNVTPEVKTKLAKNLVYINYKTHVRYVVDDVVRNTYNKGQKTLKYKKLLEIPGIYTQDDINHILDAINNPSNPASDNDIKTNYIVKPGLEPATIDQLFLFFQQLRGPIPPGGAGAAATPATPSVPAAPTCVPTPAQQQAVENVLVAVQGIKAAMAAAVRQAAGGAPQRSIRSWFGRGGARTKSRKHSGIRRRKTQRRK